MRQRLVHQGSRSRGEQAKPAARTAGSKQGRSETDLPTFPESFDVDCTETAPTFDLTLLRVDGTPRENSAYHTHGDARAKTSPHFTLLRKAGALRAAACSTDALTAAGLEMCTRLVGSWDSISIGVPTIPVVAA